MAEPEAILHPRGNPRLFGHAAAEQQFLDAISEGRLAHGWLIGGPRGIGKATLAYRVARYLLGGGTGMADMFGGGASLAVDPDTEVFHQVAGGAHPDLSVIERTVNERTGRLRGEIVVEQIRGLGERFTLTSSAGGWRIGIIDGAEEMNPNAANALLKLLEEPPPRSLILLVSHAPGRLLPTIRSRCRLLALRPLALETVLQVLHAVLPGADAEAAREIARLADGSPGRALHLAALDGIAVHQEIQRYLMALPKVDYGKVHELADRLTRPNQDAAFRAWAELLDLSLTRLVRTAAGGSGGELLDGEAETAAHLAGLAPPDRWVDAWEQVNDLIARGEGLNLDRRQTILSAFQAMERVGAGR